MCRSAVGVAVWKVSGMSRTGEKRSHGAVESPSLRPDAKLRNHSAVVLQANCSGATV